MTRPPARGRGLLAAALLCATSPAGADGTYREGLFHYEIADFEAARTAWSVCAEDGDYRCQFGLGVLYKSGSGVEGDAAQARRWFEAAARQGSTDAALELGILYAIGPPGVGQDPVLAYAWLLLAARDGDPVAEDRRSLMHSLLSESEIREGEARARALIEAMGR